MKVLVTGAAGQLGHDVLHTLASREIECVGCDIREAAGGAHSLASGRRMPYIPLDITDGPAVSRVMHEVRPDALIHCAAWTAVDDAEKPENLATVQAINVDGTGHLARACAALDCKMMYISTDYVFDGQGETPWPPDCKAYAPLNVYGKTKLAGEQIVSSLLKRFFIVRIAWVFSQNGRNFVKTMLRLGQTQDAIRVVCDQIGTPTYTPDLARLLADMIQTERYGYYHATNEGGYISWYDFACEILRQAGLPADVIPVTTQEFGLSRAARPFNSRLDKAKLLQNGFAPLPDWKDALRRFLSVLDAEPEPSIRG